MDIDFRTIGVVLAGISFGLIGITMAGGMLWPEAAQKAQKQIQMVIQGLVIIMISGLLIAAFGG